MAWYNASWTKRKKITLTGGSDGAQANYQLKLAVTYDSDMQADFDDLRFTKSDGTTLVNAWLESSSASSSAVIWVKFVTTPANTLTEDYYMYYGNSGASSAWSGADTFNFFDGFEGTTLDSQWNETSGINTVSGGRVDVRGDIRCSTFTKTYCRYRAGIFPNGHAASYRAGMTNSSIANSFATDDSAYFVFGSLTPPAHNLAAVVSNDGSSTGDWYDVYDEWFRPYEIRWEADRVRYYENDTLFKTHEVNVPNEPLSPRFELTTSGSNVYVYWVFISEYVDGEATYVFGGEELPGWTGTIMGVDSPARIMNIEGTDITSVIGIS
jgi:hypothetical protein